MTSIKISQRLRDTYSWLVSNQRKTAFFRRYVRACVRISYCTRAYRDSLEQEFLVRARPNRILSALEKKNDNLPIQPTTR